MKRYAVLIALVFMLGWLGSPVLRSWGQGEPTPTPARMTIRQWDAAGNITDFECVALPTIATPTPEGETTTPPVESATPTVKPSTTSTPTVAPTPTASSTPLPLCRGEVNTDVLNARSGPGTSYGVVTQYERGDSLGLLERAGDWYLVSRKPVLYVSAQYVTVVESSGCTFAIVTPTPTPPKTTAILKGPHLLNGPGASLAVDYSSQLSLVKCVQDYGICQEIKQRNPQIKTIARTLVTDYGMVDGPPVWMWGDPSQWWAGIKNHLPDGFDYYEVVNEVGPPPQGWEYWAQWSIAIAQMVERDKGGKLLAFSFAPGNPDYPEWHKLIPYLEWAAQHGHGVAFHAAPFMSLPVPTSATWVNAPHLAGRIIFVCNELEIYGFDCYRLTWWETEVGLSDGYSGLWDYPWTCEQIADSYKTTGAYLQAHTPVDGFAWWNIGLLSRWTDDSRCLNLMVN